MVREQRQPDPQSPGNVVNGRVILERAAACLERLPPRIVTPKTLKAYRTSFARMLREPVLDALRPGMARDTYTHRRASLHAGSRILLTKLMALLVKAGDSFDSALGRRVGAVLQDLLDRIEPALALDPPLLPGASTWEMRRSRWHDMDIPGPRRGKMSKKHLLGLMPDDWEKQIGRAHV